MRRLRERNEWKLFAVLAKADRTLAGIWWTVLVLRGLLPAGRVRHRHGRAGGRRLAKHLFTLVTTAAPGKEVRVTGIGGRIADERREAWERWYGPVADARWGSAAWHALAWTVFGGAWAGAVAFVSAGLRAPAADVLLVLAAGARLSAYIGATVGEIGFLRGIWMDGSRRLAWLEDYAASLVVNAGLPVPAKLIGTPRLESHAARRTARVSRGDLHSRGRARCRGPRGPRRRPPRARRGWQYPAHSVHSRRPDLTRQNPLVDLRQRDLERQIHS